MDDVVNAKTTARAKANPKRNERLQFDEDSFHRWYHFVLGYSDRLVTEVFETLEIEANSLVLDPFCGGGTTLIEAAKRGVQSIGIDANPFAAFAARVKTGFSLEPADLSVAAATVQEKFHVLVATDRTYHEDATFRYLKTSGMLDRGWISPRPLRKALMLKDAINTCTTATIRDALMLALMADLATNIGNMKFGPQIYKGATKDDVDPIPGFLRRVKAMEDDLLKRGRQPFGTSTVVVGDARTLKPALRSHFGAEIPMITSVVCSPPYPTEHDYTRHTRLELAFMDDVTTLSMLRSIKKSMIRSHTKGIYKGDADADRAHRLAAVEEIAREVELAVEGKESGFEKLYPTVVRSYFGGMRRHFGSLFRLMRSGGNAAYVVGDQAAYMRIPIRTAALLGETAESVGFRVTNITRWRQRWATNMSALLDENILYLSKP